MKVIESLTFDQKNLILQGEPTGIFLSMINSTDNYYTIRGQICQYYYLTHSPQKTITPVIDVMDKIIIETSQNIDKFALLGEQIGNRFRRKWTRTYTMLGLDYEFLYDEEHTITKNGDHNILKIYDSQNETDENRNSKETTTSTNSIDNDIYGFNSVTAVGADTTAENGTEIREGLFEDNHTKNVRKNSGRDNDIHQINDTETYMGRNKPISELIDKEIYFRNQHEFIEMVCRDINTIFTINVYN